MGKLTDDSGGGPLNPGETRVIHARDKRGDVIKTITVHRTMRPFVDDLCDAYNDARTREALERGVEWYVNAAGELKIGFAVKDPAVRRIHQEQ